MPKYQINYSSHTYYYLTVEAPSYIKAQKIAQNTDGGDFVQSEHGDWEPEPQYDAIEINNTFHNIQEKKRHEN